MVRPLKLPLPYPYSLYINSWDMGPRMRLYHDRGCRCALAAFRGACRHTEKHASLVVPGAGNAAVWWQDCFGCTCMPKWLTCTSQHAPFNVEP